MPSWEVPVQPFRVGVAGFLPRGTFAQEDDVGDDIGALGLERVDGRRIAPRKSARSARYSRVEAFSLSSVKRLVIRASTPPGFKAIDALGEEEIMDGPLLAGIVDIDVAERRIADHGVDGRDAAILEAFDADIGLRMQGTGDPPGHRIQLDADESLAGLALGHEITGAAAGF